MGLGYKPLTRGRKPHPPPAPVPTLDITFDAGMDARLVSMWSATDPGDRPDTDASSQVSPSMCSVANGILTMTCHRQATPSGRPFAGAAIATYGTFSQRFGTFETRMRYDEAKGTFPAWFMLPVGQKGPYPEIDMMEAHGDAACLGAGFITTSVSTSSTSNEYKSFIPVPAPSDGWHVHKMVWTSTRIDFYIDGVLTYSVTNPAHISQTAMYPIYLWGVGDPSNTNCRADNTTPDTLTMQVDYLRVWPLA